MNIISRLVDIISYKFYSPIVKHCIVFSCLFADYFALL